MEHLYSYGNSSNDDFGYALKSDKKTLIHIDEVNEEMRHDGFFCLSCEEELVPVLGKKRRHHFRHKEKNPNRQCYYESYLHKLAKKILLLRFQNNDKFNIILTTKNTCKFVNNCAFNCPKVYPNSTNLKEYYDTATEEGVYDDYRADVLLSCSDSSKKRCPVFLEIYVSHSCTQKKLDSRNKIIEFYIQSETDACQLFKMDFSDFNPKIHFYNFRKECAHKPMLKDRVSLVKDETEIKRIEDKVVCIDCQEEYTMYDNSIFDIIYKDNFDANTKNNWFIALSALKVGLKCCTYCVGYQQCHMLFYLKGYKNFDPLEVASICSNFKLSGKCENYLKEKGVLNKVIMHSS